MPMSRRLPPAPASGCSNWPYETKAVKAVSAKAFKRAVERKGWTLLRISGSHHIYGKDGEVARLSIPVHGNRALKLGLQKSLMAIAGVGESDL